MKSARLPNSFNWFGALVNIGKYWKSMKSARSHNTSNSFGHIGEYWETWNLPDRTMYLIHWEYLEMLGNIGETMKSVRLHNLLHRKWLCLTGHRASSVWLNLFRRRLLRPQIHVYCCTGSESEGDERELPASMEHAQFRKLPCAASIACVLLYRKRERGRQMWISYFNRARAISQGVHNATTTS